MKKIEIGLSVCILFVLSVIRIEHIYCSNPVPMLEVAGAPNITYQKIFNDNIIEIEEESTTEMSTTAWWDCLSTTKNDPFYDNYMDLLMVVGLFLFIIFVQTLYILSYRQ
ncbi:hypothetical protein NEOKW01_2004 [Nematocida sp. AWRm80]|nr:hypothetical protein NEOKW01_2004 [Nematocida sp. AWRm80]